MTDAAPLHDDKELNKLADSAKEYQPAHPKPRILSAREFMAAERPPLEFHIEGLLPKGGKLTFSAPAKWGKSWWAIQTGLALAAGDCDFLGWRFGAPARVLYIQVEIADGLIEIRLKTLFKSPPSGIDADRARDNFLVREITSGAPNLSTDEGRKRAEGEIAGAAPEIVIFDPLCFLFPGLDENSAEKMGEALRFLTDLSIRHRFAVILIHHAGKSGGGSRGSSIFEGWPETDLQAAFVDPERKDVAKVSGRLRCAWGGGPWHWRLPRHDDPWIEAMPEGEAPTERKGGRTPVYAPLIVQTILRAEGRPMSWKDLTLAVQQNSGCKERKAQELIQEAAAPECGLVLKSAAGGYAALTPPKDGHA